MNLSSTDLLSASLCSTPYSLFLFLAHRHVVIKLDSEQRSEYYFLILRNHFLFDEHMISMNSTGKKAQRAKDAGGVSPARAAKEHKASNNPCRGTHTMLL